MTQKLVDKKNINFVSDNILRIKHIINPKNNSLTQKFIKSGMTLENAQESTLHMMIAISFYISNNT